jgi:predicted  nucleic acid-binding Zn-ribbon protein
MSQSNTFTIDNSTIDIGNTVIIVTDNINNKQYISEYKRYQIFGPSYYDDTLRENILSCIQNNNIIIEFITQPILYIDSNYCNIYEADTFKLLIQLPISTNYVESGKALHRLVSEKQKNNKRHREECEELKTQSSKLKEECEELKTQSSTLKEENNKLKRQIKKLKTVHFENNNMDSDNLLKSFEFEFDKLNRHIEFLKQDNINLNNDYKTLKELDDIVIYDLVNEKKDLQLKYDGLKEEVQRLNDFISSIEVDISSYEL